MRKITLEFLRHGPSHNQLLSRITNYLALCENYGAQTVQMPFDHGQLMHRLHALGYKSDEGSRAFQLEDTASTLCEVLAQVDGLTAELGRRCRDDGGSVAQLRLVISASELALIPFELANAPHGCPGAGQSLLLQNQLPLCLTREVRRAGSLQFNWPRAPKILFVIAQPASTVPLDAHLLALRRVLEPWIHADTPEERQAEVAKFLTILPDATADSLQEACSREAYTHVHILAHGIRYQDREDFRFGLAFHARDAADPYDIVTGIRLATLLRAVQQPAGRELSFPAVVTLACCDSGNVGSVIDSVAGAGSSVAHALHAAGIPMVVASQFPLTFEGSILMVEILYGGLLRGLDPRGVLNDLRRQLKARLPRSHDWASIVAYAAFPPDFDRQIIEVQYERAKAGIDAVLIEVDRRVLELSTWWQAKHPNRENETPGGTSSPSNSPAPPPRRSAREILDFYRNRIANSEKVLRAMLATERQTSRTAERVNGLLAGIKKREAQILYTFAKNGGVAISQEYENESLRALSSSLDLYKACMRARPNESWPLHQVLALSLALGDKTFPHASIWLQALSMGLARLRQVGDECFEEPNKAAAWAHTDLLELYLVACDTNPWPDQSSRLVQAALQQLHPEIKEDNIAIVRATHHAKELVRLAGCDLFAVEATVRQLVRYHEWLAKLPQSFLQKLGQYSQQLLEILAPGGEASQRPARPRSTFSD